MYLTNYIFTINTVSRNKSLNLSHAVSVISYELFNLKKVNSNYTDNHELANNLELSNFMNALIKDLDSDSVESINNKVKEWQGRSSYNGNYFEWKSKK